MLDAYCWPLSAASGETVRLHASGDVGSCTIEVARDGAEREEVWRADDVAVDAHADPRRCQRERLWLAGHDRDPARSLVAIGVLRGHAHRRHGASGRLLRDPPTRRRPGSHPARARHHHVERLQRLGWAVPLHRRHPRLVRASVREGLPGEAGAGRPHDADHARPRGDGLSELGAAAGPVRLERGRGLVELGTAVPALGGVERLPGGRRHVARPRGAPGGPAGSPAEPPRRSRRVLVVGHARHARRPRRQRRERAPSSAATRASGRSGSKTTAAR